MQPMRPRSLLSWPPYCIKCRPRITRRPTMRRETTPLNAGDALHPLVSCSVWDFVWVQCPCCPSYIDTGERKLGFGRTRYRHHLTPASMRHYPSFVHASSGTTWILTLRTASSPTTRHHEPTVRQRQPRRLPPGPPNATTRRRRTITLGRRQRGPGLHQDQKGVLQPRPWRHLQTYMVNKGFCSFSHASDIIPFAAYPRS